MTAVVQVATNGLVIQGGWWPMIGWAVRASDGRLVARVTGWRGGQGVEPPTGYLREGGALTDDPDDAWAFPRDWVSVVGMRGEARGWLAARMRIAASTAAGEITSTWTDVDERCEADNGDPGDTGAILRLPTNPDPDQIGWLLVGERNNETRVTMLAWGEFTGQTGVVLPLAAPGEAVTVRYRTPLDGERDYFELALRQGPLAGDAVVSVYALTTGVAGVQASDLAEVRAAVAANARAVAALDAEVRALPTRGAAAAPEADAAELDGGIETRLRSFSPADVWRAARAAVSLVWLAIRMGGWVRSVTSSSGQLHAVQVGADGQVRTQTITLGAGAGGTQAHTDDQIRNLAGALVASTGPFSFDSATGTLMYTQPAPAAGSVGQAALSQALAAVIAAKLDAPAVNDQIGANALIVALRAFMVALKGVTEIASGVVAQGASNVFARVGADEWPDALPDDDVVVRVQAAGVDVSQTIAYGAVLAKQSSRPGPASSSNSVRFSAQGATYSVTREQGTNRVLFASDSIGDYTVTVSLKRINPTRYIAGLPETALAAALRAKIDTALAQGGHTDAEIRALIEAEYHRLTENIDVVATKTVAPRPSGNGSEIVLNLGFSVGETAFSIVSVFRGANGDPEAFISPEGSRDNSAFRAWDVRVNAGTEAEYTLKIVDAVRNSDTSTHDSFRWQDAHGGQPAFENPCTVDVVAPPSKANLVPGTGTGVLQRAEPGDAAAFGEISHQVFVQADRDKFESISTGAEVNPRIATVAEMESGESQDLRSLSPWLVNKLVQARAPRSNPETVLHDGAGVGLSVTNSGQTRRGNLTLFNPTPGTYFDLDDGNNLRGTVLVEAVVRLETRSDVQIGFDSDTSDPTIEARITGFIFARNLRAAAVYAAGSDQGVRVGSAVVRRGAATLGTVSLWHGKNAVNRLGYWMTYAGSSRSDSWAFALNPLEVAFLHSD